MPGWYFGMPIDNRLLGFDVSESESESQLTYMIDIALTMEFAISSGGVR